MNRAITLLSGGLDSFVATALAIHKYDVVLAITFDYGQRSAKRETDAALSISKDFSIKHQVIELPWLASITNTALVNRCALLPKTDALSLDEDAASRAKAVWVPNRNGIFIAIAAALAESQDIGTIIAGFNAEEAQTFPDNGIAFVEATNLALSKSTNNSVAVVSPTIDITKCDIARHFIDLKLDAKHLWCCYDGLDSLCGRCESCARTIRAFKEIESWNVISNRFAKFS